MKKTLKIFSIFILFQDYAGTFIVKNISYQKEMYINSFRSYTSRKK